MSAAARHRPDSAALFVLAAVSLALLTILSVWKLKQFKYRLINETGGAMFYGMLLGLLVKYVWFDREEHGKNMGSVCTCHGLNGTVCVTTVNDTSHQHIGKNSRRCSFVSMGTFDPEVLFDLFLPAVIFYGAYTLNQKRLIQNLGSVVTYAFLGTLISCICIGACMYGFTRLVVLLKPTADGKFFLTDCLLFGAIMSATDPVSVLGLLSDLRVDFDLRTLLFGESVLNDAVAIVLTHAIATYDQMGAGRIFDPPAFFHSVGFFLGVLIGSFLLGFVFAVITALLTKFTRLHESPLLETSVFFLLSWSSFLSAEACGLSGIVAVLFCGLSQARYTILNLSHEGRTRTKQISWAVQHFMVFAGLRGVIAFSLAIRDTSTEVKKTILTTTLLLVVFTVWVLGAAADPLLRRLDLRVEEEEADEDPQEVPFEDDQGMPDATRGLWHCLDHQYLKPLLTHCGPPLTDSLPRWCGGFAKVFSSSRLQEDEEQLCEAQPDASTVSLEKTELTSTRSDSGSEHQEDLLEGDLGLGAGVSPRPEFPGVSSNDDLSSPPPTAHGDTGQGI
ncbi:sodium/hydrogen exchanger 9 isoform X2 [Kryptolebias marmoratus]|uniref:sodium/hydrogen exchanger 9 isoform X2 n=1 Tax=Kryptolebias marmoratus TaxID=37003 RepID=UPI000D52F3A4|nr:sodium/hydrogen exchanger 9 isoform X2 [Kryptolebias marmoratus]